MKYIKLFEEHGYSVYDLITMGVVEAQTLLMKEIDNDVSDLELIRDILDYSVIDINQSDSLGWIPLIYAVLLDKKDVIELLFKHPNINVNVQDIAENTPLIHAVRKGSERMIELLLKHPKIDVNIQNRWGNMAWDMASYSICKKFPQLNPDFI
jgi:ankyrin repeat protein